MQEIYIVGQIGLMVGVLILLVLILEAIKGLDQSQYIKSLERDYDRLKSDLIALEGEHSDHVKDYHEKTKYTGNELVRKRRNEKVVNKNGKQMIEWTDEYGATYVQPL